jgi:hypothetical protein
MNTAWLNEVRQALLLLKDLQERIEALEAKVDSKVSAALFNEPPVYIEPKAMDVLVFEPAKRKPGRPRKNGN